MHVTEGLVERIRQRAKAGLAKYGVTLDRTDLTRKEWLIHTIEEAGDLAAYLYRLQVMLSDGLVPVEGYPNMLAPSFRSKDTQLALFFAPRHQRGGRPDGGTRALHRRNRRLRK